MDNNFHHREIIGERKYIVNSYVKKYEHLVDFLADFLGENAEVVLHDFSDLEHSVVKVRNGHISGRKKGDPSTDFAVRSFQEVEPGTHYRCNYHGMTKEGKRLKSASYYIRNSKRNIVGMLCVNLDVEHYLNARKYLDRLFMIETHGDSKKARPDVQNIVNENFGKSIPELIVASLEKAIGLYNCEVNRLSYSEKEKIIEQVNAEGIFLLKGAVNKAAQMLSISEPTVYRYLGKVKNS